jgi:hypothetical protein
LKKPVQDAAGHSIKELFDTICDFLKRKFGENSEGALALGLAVEKPESAMRWATLAEAIAEARLDRDRAFLRLLEHLALMLTAESNSVKNRVNVSGQQNKVLVAGRDVVHTERIVHRSEVTPDERHITDEQKSRIRGLVGELASRMGTAEGKPNFAAGHRMLQRKFAVDSYALIPRERFDEAERFLKQRCLVQRHRASGCRIG